MSSLGLLFGTSIANSVGPLASNVVVNWSGTTTVYIAPSNITGFEVYRIILKNPSGTQPLTWSASQNGTIIQAGLSIPGSGQGVVLNPTLIVIGAAGQSITISGVTNTSGTALCSITGVVF